MRVNSPNPTESVANGVPGIRRGTPAIANRRHRTSLPRKCERAKATPNQQLPRRLLELPWRGQHLCKACASRVQDMQTHDWALGEPSTRPHVCGPSAPNRLERKRGKPVTNEAMSNEAKRFAAAFRSWHERVRRDFMDKLVASQQLTILRLCAEPPAKCERHILKSLSRLTPCNPGPLKPSRYSVRIWRRIRDDWGPVEPNTYEYDLEQVFQEELAASEVEEAA
jgi:hypothetical protein